MAARSYNRPRPAATAADLAVSRRFDATQRIRTLHQRHAGLNVSKYVLVIKQLPAAVTAEFCHYISQSIYTTRRYTTRPGASTTVSGKHDQKVHS